jgi:uncharacterized membrane protein YoaK (UPF0700 family)
MLNFFDYIFYRLYLTYEKAKEGPVFSTVLVFSSFFLMFVGIPLACLGAQLFNKDNIFIVILLIVYALGLIPILRRYNKKKIGNILIKYKYNKWNKRLKTWVIFTGVVIGFPVGTLVGFLIGGCLVSGVRIIIEYYRNLMH